MSAPMATLTLPAVSPLFLRNLAPPVANSALHERQFLLFIEARQAAKKPGKRRTSSEKNSGSVRATVAPFQLTPSGRQE
jgi:hypothetical protein